MKTTRWLLTLMVLLAVVPAARADRRGALDVELWTDRGNDAVYQPGENMELRVRSSDDGYLLVYEIDSEGYVRLLWPDHGSRGYIEGRQTLQVPSPRSNLELVVEQATGQGYLVALVSDQPFRALPWYLRPYDPQAEGAGYEGESDDEDGITSEGRIVGDPFVAMERIRRSVLADPDDADGFGTAYTTYYVHERVRYPRYLCNDCHRPGYWAWWDGFDPYYASCSVFDFRVNWGWYWGPTYWFGTVPYYYYVVRNDCPPRYRFFSSHGSYSSWNGWRSWQNLMGGNIRRYKSPPPPGYVPPSKYDERGRGANRVPPGFLAGREVAPGRHGGGLRSTDTGLPDGNSRRFFRDPGGRIERPRDVARGGLLNGRSGDPGRGRDEGDPGRRAFRSGGDRPERPRDVSRGGLVVRPDGPGRGRWSVNDPEPSRTVRGIPDRGSSWNRGRLDPEPRPRDERRWFRAPAPDRGRMEPRWERPRQESRQESRPEPRQVERRQVERREERPRDDSQRSPERRSEDRGGDRGRGGRPGR